MLPLRDTIRSYHKPVMTWTIITANVLVFLYTQVIGTTAFNQFVQDYGLVPARWQTQPAWLLVTLFTGMFIHSGWFHILSNMWVLFIFGDNVEDRMGSIGFLVFYLLSGLAASGLEILSGINSTVPVIGASGAIAGVLGAYIILYPRAKVVTLVFIVFFITTFRIPAFVFLGFWFLSQVYSGLTTIGSASGGIAWWAHIGGFLFGMLMVRFFLFRPTPYPGAVYYEPQDPQDTSHLRW